MDTNKRFGNWTILGPGAKPRYWHCRCDCGREKDVFSSSITTGASHSCGCLRGKASITHGMTKHPLYKIWSGIRARCNNPHRPGWKYYGGDGISICPEWDNAKTFIEWAFANGYRPGLTIERIDITGNYEPANCRWIPMEEQARNRRQTLWLEVFGERKTFSEWARDPRCIVNRGTFWIRIKRGMSPEQAMTNPLYNGGEERKSRDK